MPVVKKTCRVCGKTYEACRSANSNPMVFHWQEVACSPECGAEYLRMVNEARNPQKKVTHTATRKRAKKGADASTDPSIKNDETE